MCIEIGAARSKNGFLLQKNTVASIQKLFPGKKNHIETSQRFLYDIKFSQKYFQIFQIFQIFFMLLKAHDNIIKT